MKHPARKDLIARCAYERVKNEHTYVKRIEIMLSQVRRLYG